MSVRNAVPTTPTQGRPRGSSRRRGHQQKRIHSSLRVVAGGDSATVERFPLRLRVIALVVSGIVVLFSLIAFHVVLSQGQFRLEKLQTAAQSRQAEYQRLRLQVAQLEAPTTVNAAARDRLGMVTPESVTPVTPSAGDMPKDLAVTTPSPTSVAGNGDDAEFAHWTKVKPYVSLSTP